MTDPFVLSVDYKGKKLDFIAQLVPKGYTHQFKVLINETAIFFEPDEEGLYRAVQMPGQDDKELTGMDRHLLGLVGRQIEDILR